jgi:hypothetical protein
VTRYKHTQIGYPLIWFPAAASVLSAIGATFELSPHREILLVVSIVFLITIPLFYKLTITADDETLLWSFGEGIIRKKVRVVEIAGCEPVRVHWWYGWGIHLTPYGWLYNVAGWDAVAITLQVGRKFALGTDDPQGLTDAIRHCAGI